MDKYHYVESGLDNVWLLGGYRLEQDEEFGEILFVEDIEGLHKVIAEALLKKRSPLLGSEFRYLRKYCQLSQADAANVIQSNEQSIAKWEKAREKVVGNRPAEALFRAFAAYQIGGDMGLSNFIKVMGNIRTTQTPPSIEANHQIDDEWHSELKLAA